MPAKSKGQRRLFALALQYKREELALSDVSDEVKELSKLPEDKLKDYAKTKETDLPDRVEEDVTVNPNMNTQGMGNVVLPGDPGSADSFASQDTGSGDQPFPQKKKKPKLLSFSQFLYKMKAK